MRNKRYNKRFDEEGYMKKDIGDVVVDMNDIKGMMREFIMYKMEEDMEDIVRKYLEDKVVKDNKVRQYGRIRKI